MQNPHKDALSAPHHAASSHPRKRGGFRRRLRLRKGLQLLPNLFTLGNAFFGFCSVIFAAQTDLVGAAYFILLGALMDALDGRIARFAGVTSDLGMQLDSLCDGVSFCLAPAFLMYAWQLKKMGFIGLMASGFFLVCGLLRLARFNITHDQQTTFFLGMPTTIAGCFLATIMLNASISSTLTPYRPLLLAVVVTLALLMPSRVRFPTFKHINKNWYALAFFITLGFTITLALTQVLLLMFIIYFATSISLDGYRRLFNRRVQEVNR